MSTLYLLCTIIAESNGVGDDGAMTEAFAEQVQMAAGAGGGMQTGMGASTIPQEAVYTAGPPGAPPPRVVMAQAPVAKPAVLAQARSTVS